MVMRILKTEKKFLLYDLRVSQSFYFKFPEQFTYIILSHSVNDIIYFSPTVLLLSLFWLKWSLSHAPYQSRKNNCNIRPAIEHLNQYHFMPLQSYNFIFSFLIVPLYISIFIRDLPIHNTCLFNLSFLAIKSFGFH